MGEWEIRWLAFSESVEGRKPGDGIETVLEAGCEGGMG